MQVSNEVPLTLAQKTQLFIDCLPLPFFIMGLIFVVTILNNVTGKPPPVLLILFLAVVILAVGWTAINRVRDLFFGVALVQEDVLHRAWHSRGSARRHPFSGKFEQLGIMRLSRDAWGQGRNNDVRYRVFYSPASKVVWALEELE